MSCWAPGAGSTASSWMCCRWGVAVRSFLRFDDIIASGGPGAPTCWCSKIPSPASRTAVVAGEDGDRFFGGHCAATTRDDSTAGCAGVNPVSATPKTACPTTDPLRPGRKAFDLRTSVPPAAPAIYASATAAKRIYAAPRRRL